MAMIEINKDPSQRELRWFGILFAVFFGAIGAVVYARSESPTAAYVLWGIAAGVPCVFFAVPALRRPIYLAWIYAAFPIGWTISNLVLAAVYFLVLTPIGLAMRLLGRDPMHRRFEPHAETYWVEHRPEENPSRYFRQF